MNDNYISYDLAELLGVITGDGCLTVYNFNKRADYKLTISGGYEEIIYYEYLSNLLERLFKIKPRLVKREDGIYLVLGRKYVVYALNNLGIPIGKKSNYIGIPNYILNNKELALHFMRGLADTDFCVTFKKDGKYPVIALVTSSKNLTEAVIQILKNHGFTFNLCSRDRITNFGKIRHHELHLNGKKNLRKWMNLIGFNNIKHITKVEVWDKFGFCPAHTNLKQRLELLKR